MLRCSVVQSLSRAAIQFGGDPIASVLGEVGHALALREVLADEAVGVLVGAALPRVMRRGEIYR